MYICIYRYRERKRDVTGEVECRAVSSAPHIILCMHIHHIYIYIHRARESESEKETERDRERVIERDVTGERVHRYGGPPA